MNKKMVILVLSIFALLVIVFFFSTKLKWNGHQIPEENVFLSDEYSSYTVCGRSFVEMPIYVNKEDVVNKLMKNIESELYKGEGGPTCNWMVPITDNNDSGAQKSNRLELMSSFVRGEGGELVEIIIDTSNSFPMPDYQPVNNRNHYDFIISPLDGSIEFNKFVLNQDPY